MFRPDITALDYDYDQLLICESLGVDQQKAKALKLDEY